MTRKQENQFIFLTFSDLTEDFEFRAQSQIVTCFYIYFFVISGTSSAQLLRFSKQYRSVMRDCQETLDKWSENPNLDEETREAYIGQSELLYKLELMWNLIEVLCIEKNPIILPSLLQWISLHFPKCDEKAKNVLGASGGQSENIDEYDKFSRHSVI